MGTLAELLIDYEIGCCVQCWTGCCAKLTA